jgi:GntR family transcriptional regulator
MLMTKAPATLANRAKFQPLYAQVKDLIVKRIGSGEWEPGKMIPNEFQLADEFNVSQGTVRKALIALESEKLIIRRQGRGTYVARHTSQRMLFQFFRIVGRGSEPLTPISKPLSQTMVKADNKQARILGINPGQKLHVIFRIRYFDDDPAILERIYVPISLMPDLKIIPGKVMTEEMYSIYQEHYSATIARAKDKIRAISATQEDAKHLKVNVGDPLLEIMRVAVDLKGRIVEMRTSRCKTNAYSYATDVV